MPARGQRDVVGGGAAQNSGDEHHSGGSDGSQKSRNSITCDIFSSCFVAMPLSAKAERQVVMVVKPIASRAMFLAGFSYYEAGGRFPS